jgi:hypothetical protein
MNNLRIVSPPAVVTIDDVVTAIDAIGGRNRDATGACGAEALRADGTVPQGVTRAADALLSNEGIVSSFEHVSGSQRNVRTRSRVTDADKMRARKRL